MFTLDAFENNILFFSRNNQTNRLLLSTIEFFDIIIMNYYIQKTCL